MARDQLFLLKPDFRDDSGQFNDVFDNRFGSVGP